jgi:hypothetical protein
VNDQAARLRQPVDNNGHVDVLQGIDGLACRQARAEFADYFAGSKGRVDGNLPRRRGMPGGNKNPAAVIVEP